MLSPSDFKPVVVILFNGIFFAGIGVSYAIFPFFHLGGIIKNLN